MFHKRPPKSMSKKSCRQAIPIKVHATEVFLRTLFLKCLWLIIEMRTCSLWLKGGYRVIQLFSNAHILLPKRFPLNLLTSALVRMMIFISLLHPSTHIIIGYTSLTYDRYSLCLYRFNFSGLQLRTRDSLGV